MPKRSHKNDSDYLRRKLRRIEKKLAKCDERRHYKVSSHTSSSGGSTNDSPVPQDVDPDHEAEREVQFEADLVSTIVEESRPGTSMAEASVSDVLQTEPSAESNRPAEPSELDEEILNLLGETPSKDKKYGSDIRSELAVRWEHIATTGLPKDSKKELFENYPVPKNCTKIDAPKLNPEIQAALSEMLIKKDKALENKQKQVAAIITCISEALTRLFSLEHKDQTVLKLLIEAGRLICDTQHNESMTRRSFICSTINKDIKDQLFKTEIDGYLFGEKLADTLRAAKAISKSGAEIKITPARKTTPAQKPRQAPMQALNQKPPLSTARRAGATMRFEPTQTTSSTPRPRLPHHHQQRQPPRSQYQPGPRR